MSHNPNSQDIAKQTTNQLGQIAKSAAHNKRVRKLAMKGFKAAAKFLKMFITKLIPAIIKALVAFFGPYIFLVILIIILLFIVMDSVASFDFFGKGGERNEAEVLFDNTIKEVVVDRSDKLANPLVSKLRSQQSSDPYSPVNEMFLQQVSDMMIPSWAITGTLYNYKNLKKSSYKAWHTEFRDTPVGTASEKATAREKFYSEINSAYDYYFTHQSMNVDMTYGKSSGEKKEIRKETSCSIEEVTTDPDTGEESKTVKVENTTTNSVEDLPQRDVVTGATLLYSTTSFTYTLETGDWVSEGKTTNENCTTETFVKYTLYQLDDEGSPMVTYDAQSLLSFLLVNTPEGDLSRIVKPEDLEYVLETAEHIDDLFPKISVDFEGLIKCAKDQDVAGCIGANITGSFFNIGFGGGWFPEELKPLYEAAAQEFNVDWFVLASIHAQETNFSSNPAASNPSLGSSVGAKGHLQHMLRTWIGWSFSGNSSFSVTGSGDIRGPLDSLITFVTNPSTIAKYGGYGTDGNGNGQSSPWEIEDAVYTAAKQLSKNGYVKDNEEKIKKALWHYNHSNHYVNEVYNRAISFRDGGFSIDDGTGAGNASVVEVGKRWIGNSVYVFGGGRNQNDIARGRFDCSSFVHWAFAQVGINLGPLTSTSTETLKNKGTAVSPSDIQPGDVVFFNTYKTDGHVGIYVGNGKFIGAQSSTGVAIADMSTGYWKQKFNGRVKRIQ